MLLCAKAVPADALILPASGEERIALFGTCREVIGTNATRGAYHFTASIEERDFLISLGWEPQGIGWYSCWK